MGYIGAILHEGVARWPASNAVKQQGGAFIIIIIIFCVFRRYFDTEEEKRDRGGPSEDSGPSSSDTSSILASAQKLIKEKKLEQAIVLLEKSRLNLPDVWILFLRVKAELILVAQEQFEGLYQFFPKAVEATGSYAVILEVH